MITIRPLEPEDKELLETSLQNDAYHQSTKADFFYQPNTSAVVYEDELGSVFVVRGTAALRIDIQFLNNRDYERNREALEAGFPAFVEKARANGFTELVFCTNSPLLKRFFKQKKYGFEEVQGELRKFI